MLKYAVIHHMIYDQNLYLWLILSIVFQIFIEIMHITQ